MANNIVDIMGVQTGALKLFPETVADEIIQNIRIILTTAIGTVPLDRTFGVNTDYMDDPSPLAMMKLAIYVLESVQDYEERVEVKEVDFVNLPGQAMEGKLFPKVTVRILDEYLS